MLMYIQYPASHFRGLLTCLSLSLIQSLSLSSMYTASGDLGFGEMTQGGDAGAHILNLPVSSPLSRATYSRKCEAWRCSL